MQISDNAENPHALVFIVVSAMIANSNPLLNKDEL
jgi:hypothetical protein